MQWESKWQISKFKSLMSRFQRIIPKQTIFSNKPLRITIAWIARLVALSHHSCFIFSTYANLFVYYRPTAISEETCPDENVSEAGTTHTELSILEKDCCKQNFQFYDKAKQGFVERFELPLVLESKLFFYRQLFPVLLI